MRREAIDRSHMEAVVGRPIGLTLSASSSMALRQPRISSSGPGLSILQGNFL